jgi:hypothetical protein
MGGKGGKLLIKMALTAGGALEVGSLGGAAEELLELRPAVLATVFIDWHISLYSNSMIHDPLMLINALYCQRDTA